MNFIPPTYEDGTDRVFRNVGIYNSDAGNYPKENIIYSEHSESLKSRNSTFYILIVFFFNFDS